MKLRVVTVVLSLAFSQALVPCAIANAKTISITQLEKSMADQKACAAAVKSKKIVTKSIRKTCLGEPVTASEPCPGHKGPIEMFAIGTDYYFMTVGRHPEKADSPTNRQIPYVCAHGTLKGAPSPYPPGL